MEEKDDTPRPNASVSSEGQSYRASRFRRYRSVSESTEDEELLNPPTRTSRSLSECISEHSSSGSNEMLDKMTPVSSSPTSGAFTSILSGVHSRARSWIFTDDVVRKDDNDIGKMSSSLQRLETTTTTESLPQILPADSSSMPVVSEQSVTQTDQMNKRLLDSFLSRINTLSSTLISRNDDGVIYTDDLLMDRILHRVGEMKE